MVKYIFLTISTLLLLSCQQSISKSRVCDFKDLDALKGCKQHQTVFDGFPENLVFSFVAKGFDRDSRVVVYWYFESESAKNLLDSFVYYTKVPKELIVSGIDRNFLNPGEYVIKTIISNDFGTKEKRERFRIDLGEHTELSFFIVGSAIDQRGEVVKPWTRFSKTDDRIFISARVHNATPNQEIAISFIELNGRFKKTFTTNTGSNPKSSFLLYANLPNSDLPEGDFEAIIEIGGKTHAAAFSVFETIKSNIVEEVVEGRSL